jgi:hypothetical protein
MGAESVGYHEPPSVDANSDAETVGDADCRVRRVVGERLGEASLQLRVIVCRGGWCRK